MKARSESEVFSDLLSLTLQPGYIHAIAQICFRDSLVFYAGEMKASDLQKLFGGDRLIRTEITTILGLLARGRIDFTQPAPNRIQEYVDRTDRLMSELHDAMSSPMWTASFDAAATGKGVDIWRGEALREPIFYGGESAYSFQYRDLALEKYRADDQWLIQNKGFSIVQAQTIAKTICGLVNERATEIFRQFKRSGVPPATWLPAFEQSPNEIASRAGIPVAQVQAFLDAFTLQGNNEQYRSVGDFNAINATPLLPTGHGTVLLLQYYSIYESLYESPFYWMTADTAYQSTAAKHRGTFTETFAARRLSEVFGTSAVHSNVLLTASKGKIIGEIDTLVVFGNRLIIVQAKSKKLTLESRRGNDGQLRKDFAGAIQDSYDQAWLCAQSILVSECNLLDANKAQILLQYPPEEIFIFNVVAEHYPALAFQARQFLKYQTTAKIRAPFVMDVFLLDALTEMLSTPLRLLSYVKLRVENIERLTMSHELTSLGFHLKRNLWLDPQFDMVVLEDGIAIDLDLAMSVRRDGVPGPPTPDGILTRLAGTLFEYLVHQIERSPEPATIELGLLLLTLGENTCRNIEKGLIAITHRTREDKKTHDFTIAGDYGGITFHCNPAPSEGEMQKLAAYCTCRKYAQRARQWFGVSMDARGRLQFGVALDSEWQQSAEMELITKNMSKAIPAAKLPEIFRQPKRAKVGRNDSCPCGSGKKFKRCCLGK